MASADAARASTSGSYAPSSQRQTAGDRPQLFLASFEGRFAAAMLDAVVLFIIASLMVTIGSLIILISSDFERVDPASSALVAFWACIASIPVWQLLYLLISWAWRGQTVGSAVMQIAVVRSDGRSLGILGAVARVISLLAYVIILAIAGVAAAALRDTLWQAAAAISVAVLLVVIGLAVSLADRYRRTLHDRLAGTVVIRTS